jgi:geranylgeranyl pyrophosphate synthase
MIPNTEMGADRQLVHRDVLPRHGDTVGAFCAGVGPRIDTALAASVAGLGRELGGLEGVIARAVGVDGPRGRRWRPLLGLAAARAAGLRPDDAMAVAIAAELTHTASLVLDDLPCMDDSPLRRGGAATHREAGAAGAILVAIGLLGRAAELVATAPYAAAELGAVWGRTIGLLGMSGGQAVDLAARRRLTGPRRRLHRQKTVALCVFALEGSARAAGATGTTRTALDRYATDLGWAYQLADDAADIGQDDAAGRPPGGRDPHNQSQRLMRRAERRLLQTDGLDARGVELLVALGRSVVPPAKLDSEMDSSPYRSEAIC